MKNLKLYFIPIISIIFLINLGMPLQGLSQTTEMVIQTSAQCKECKATIEKALMQEKGVKFADLNIDSKKVTIVYNAKKTNPDKLKIAISLVGYDADDIPADSAAVKRLSPCCTKEGHKH